MKDILVADRFKLGRKCEYYVLAHELLGPSLEDLLNYSGGKFSLKTVLLIADQAVSRITYIHSKDLLHCDVKPDKFLTGYPLRGTSCYASINNHNGRALSWGDDLESLGHVLLFLARGSLPWQGIQASTKWEEEQMIKEEKESMSGEMLCEGALPAELATYINYTRSQFRRPTQLFTPPYPLLAPLHCQRLQARQRV
ncbi:hypothetical protein VTI74DRAFT_7504 [Chaetomium olivicolor]